MDTKTYDYKKNAKYRIYFGLIFLLIGILLKFMNISAFGVGSLSLTDWMISVGIILIVIGTKNHFMGGMLKIDERYQKVINKASSITFMFIIYGALVLFIVGMIKPITISVANAASFVLFTVIIVYRIALWHYNRKY